MVVDEICNIKLNSHLQVYGKFIWFISSSIKSIFEQKGISQTGPFAKLLKQKHIVDSYIAFRDLLFVKSPDAFVDRQFALQTALEFVIPCDTPRELRLLKGLALPQVMQAIAAGDLASAIHRIGCVTLQSNDVVGAFCLKLNEESAILLDKIRAHELELKQTLALHQTHMTEHTMKGLQYATTTLAKDEAAAIQKLQTAIAALQTKQQALLHKIHSVTERINSQINNRECRICMETKDQPGITPCCNNVFCIPCLANSA